MNDMNGLAKALFLLLGYCFLIAVLLFTAIRFVGRKRKETGRPKTLDFRVTGHQPEEAPETPPAPPKVSSNIKPRRVRRTN